MKFYIYLEIYDGEKYRVCVKQGRNKNMFVLGIVVILIDFK